MLCALLQGRLTKALVVVTDQVEVLKVSSKIQRKVCADSLSLYPRISAFLVTVVSWERVENQLFLCSFTLQVSDKLKSRQREFYLKQQLEVCASVLINESPLVRAAAIQAALPDLLSHIVTPRTLCC